MEPYHYTASGLDWVVLENGYTIHETRHGRGVAIDDAQGLHQVIARSIVSVPWRLRGREVRFLRGELDLSQAGLGHILGTTRPTVARWEGDLDKAIPGPSDRLLRLYYAAYAAGDELAHKVALMLGEIDEAEHHEAIEAHFRSGDGAWSQLAA